MKIEINNIDDLKALFENNTSAPEISSCIEIGKSYFFRSVTYHQIGRVADISQVNGKFFIKLTSASWVADSGRWHQALKDGELSEVEPFINPSFIALDSIVDFTEWCHPLPTKQI